MKLDSKYNLFIYLFCLKLDHMVNDHFIAKRWFEEISFKLIWGKIMVMSLFQVGLLNLSNTHSNNATKTQIKNTKWEWDLDIGKLIFVEIPHYLWVVDTNKLKSCYFTLYSYFFFIHFPLLQTYPIFIYKI